MYISGFWFEKNRRGSSPPSSAWSSAPEIVPTNSVLGQTNTPPNGRGDSRASTASCLGTRSAPAYSSKVRRSERPGTRRISEDGRDTKRVLRDATGILACRHIDIPCRRNGPSEQGKGKVKAKKGDIRKVKVAHRSLYPILRSTHFTPHRFPNPDFAPTPSRISIESETPATVQDAPYFPLS